MTFHAPAIYYPPATYAANYERARQVQIPGPVVPSGWGVNIHFAGGNADQIKRIADAGFGFVRMDLAWESIERTKGVYDFSDYDELLKELAHYGIHALLIIDYNNSLYDPDVTTMHSADDRDAYARFAAAAATHFKGKPIIFELYNEPNGGFWKPSANATDYFAMAVQAADAIHAADPRRAVIAPAAIGADPAYLRQLFSHGLLGHIDAVSFHPYDDSPPETRVGVYKAVRQLIDQYAGNKRIPVICSEWGYAVWPGGPTPEVQAAWMARAYLVNLASGVDLTIWYDWRNDGTDPNNREHNFGLLLNDGSLKPAFTEAQSLIQSLRGFRFVRRIDMGDDKKWSLLFQSGSRFARVTWDTTNETTEMPAMPVVQYIEAAAVTQ